MNSASANTTKGGWRPRIYSHWQEKYDGLLIYSQTSSLFVSLLRCGLAHVAGHLIPLYWVLLSVLTYCCAGSSYLDVELQLQQPSRTSGVHSTERAMKHYLLTHLRSYVDCIASIFVNFINCWPGDPDLAWKCQISMSLWNCDHYLYFCNYHV